MRVRCISMSGESLPMSSRDPRLGVDAETMFPVTLGAEYPVYAITVMLGIPWYYIMDDDGSPWPIWSPSSLFEVIDGGLPSSWRYGFFRFDRDQQFPIISFPEWAADHFFYERLVDGEADAVAVFSRRRIEIEER